MGISHTVAMITWVNIWRRTLDPTTGSGKQGGGLPSWNSVVAGHSVKYPIRPSDRHFENVRELTASDWRSDLLRERSRTSGLSFGPMFAIPLIQHRPTRLSTGISSTSLQPPTSAVVTACRKRSKTSCLSFGPAFSPVVSGLTCHLSPGDSRHCLRSPSPPPPSSYLASHQQTYLHLDLYTPAINNERSSHSQPSPAISLALRVSYGPFSTRTYSACPSLGEMVTAVVTHHPSPSSIGQPPIQVINGPVVSSLTCTLQQPISTPLVTRDQILPLLQPSALHMAAAILGHTTRVHLREMAATVVARHPSAPRYAGEPAIQVVAGPTSSSISTSQPPTSTVCLWDQACLLILRTPTLIQPELQDPRHGRTRVAKTCTRYLSNLFHCPGSSPSISPLFPEVVRYKPCQLTPALYLQTRLLPYTQPNVSSTHLNIPSPVNPVSPATPRYDSDNTKVISSIGQAVQPHCNADTPKSPSSDRCHPSHRHAYT